MGYLVLDFLVSYYDLYILIILYRALFSPACCTAYKRERERVGCFSEDSEMEIFGWIIGLLR